MKGVILDQATFDQGDVDLAPLFSTRVTWQHYDFTLPADIMNRTLAADIIITNKVRINAELIHKLKHLKLILVAATGTDNVDIKACIEKGVIVCNVVHYATPAVIQHAIGLMLNLLTHQPSYHKAIQRGAWSESKMFCLLDYPIVEAQNKTLGIIGYGVLGKKMAEVGKSLGMKIMCAQRPGGKIRQGRVSFNELLQHADVISLHCPLTEHTYHLFDSDAFSLMKRNAILINTARGAIVDAKALAYALKTQKIAGAGIDVLDQEPPDADHPLLEKNIPNLILTPHNAWGTRETRQRLVNNLAENLKNWMNGQPENVVS